MPITQGRVGAPSQVTTNFDALFATSLSNYKTTLTDNVSSSNAFYDELKKSGLWESRDGGLDLVEDLMYELGSFDSYDGYDELNDTPTDGITQVKFEWRQGSIPITYSEKERKQNKHRLVNLVDSKVKQAELGFKEGFKRALMLGSMSQPGGLSLMTPYVSPLNASYFIEPLPKMIAFDPANANAQFGNIDSSQAGNAWWRNRTKTSTATTYSQFLAEFFTMYLSCSKGPGGPPNLILVDQGTYELMNAAYYDKYHTQNATDGQYPFENILFKKAHVVYDEDVPDVFGNVVNTDVHGTAYFINTQNFKVVYESETNFVQTPWRVPTKGDSKIAYILWMGQITCNNRKKQGVIGKIPRTLLAG